MIGFSIRNTATSNDSGLTVLLRLEFEGDFRQSVCYTWGMDGRLSGMILSNAQDRFSTKYYDAEADLYYYGYRYYSPSLGRWISRDPAGDGGGENLYVVCENQLLTCWDVLGYFKQGAHGLSGLDIVKLLEGGKTLVLLETHRRLTKEVSIRFSFWDPHCQKCEFEEKTTYHGYIETGHFHEYWIRKKAVDDLCADGLMDAIKNQLTSVFGKGISIIDLELTANRFVNFQLVEPPDDRRILFRILEDKSKGDELKWSLYPSHFWVKAQSEQECRQIKDFSPYGKSEYTEVVYEWDASDTPRYEDELAAYFRWKDLLDSLYKGVAPQIDF